MKLLVRAFLAMLLLVVAIIVALPFIVSVDDIFNIIDDRVTKTTGRTLTIKGEKNLTLFPHLALELNQVSLSNMASGSEKEMLSMDSLVVHINWLSLFNAEVDIDKFVINQPIILLEKDKKGEVNWDLLQPSATNTEVAASKSPSKLPDNLDINLGEVAIYSGQLTYIDHQANTRTELNDIDLSLLLPSLYQPLTFNGDVRYMGKLFSTISTISTPAKAIKGDTFTFSTALSSELVNLNYAGEISRQGKELRGELAVSGASVKDILAWQNQPLVAKDNAFNAFSLSGNMHLVEQKLMLTDLNIDLDELAIVGSTTLTFNQPLDIVADLDLGMLDLNPYLPESTTDVPVETVKKQDKTAKATPVVWDDTPLDLSAASAINAAILVRSSGLLFREIKLDDNEITFNLKNGLATVSLNKFNAYEGQGTGNFVLNSNARPYTLSTKFTLQGINAEPLLNDAVSFNKLMGHGAMAWQFTTRGMSQKQLINALDGNAEFKLSDGAVKGANIAKLMRSAAKILSGDITEVSLDTDFDDSEETDFSSFFGSFTFINGVGSNEDLSLESPLLRLTGNGTINLAETRINYHLNPKLVTSIQGQNNDGSGSGFSIPIKIKGPFHDIKIKPDIASKTKDKVKDKVKDKLKDLFG